MMKDVNILNLIYLFGVVQASFFSLLFFLKENRLLFDTIAGLWLALFALEFSLIIWLDWSSKEAMMISNIELLFTLLHGPFLYFYVKKLLLRQDVFKTHELLHFLPFTLGLIVVALCSKQDMESIIPFAGIASGLIYTSYCISIILRFKSYPELTAATKRNINWLLNLGIGLLIVWILPLVIVNTLRMFDQNVEPQYFYLLVPVFIFYLSLRGISHQLIYVLPSQRDTVRVNSILSGRDRYAESYINSSLGSEDMKKIYRLLVESMVETRLFLNPDLDLETFSRELGIPRHSITQTLNVYSNQNFSDFVNQFRVNEFKKQIKRDKNRNYTLFGTANECGFNSKATFNRVFKKFTGQTPTEYIERHSF